MFCGVELLARLVVPVTLTRQISVPHMFENDPSVGYRLRPNMVTHVRAWDGKKNLFRVKYKTDSLRRRVVEFESPETRNRHFVILGGSTVFGMGLADKDTLAYFLGARTRHFQPYNYAGDGYGPQNAYALIHSSSVLREVPEAEGHTVFFFQVLNQTGGHIQTLLGRFELLLDGWGESLPMYAIDEGQLPRPIGRFGDYDPLKFQVYRFLQNFHILNLLYPKFVPISDSEIGKTVEFMRALQAEVAAAKPKSQFSIAVHPLSDRHATPKIVNAFKDAGLTVIDFSSLVEEDQLNDYIAFSRYFPHPNGRLNEKFATSLIDVLKLD